MTNDDLIQEYDALKNGCGMVRLTNWTLLELTGADRKSFLHNFCTADVKALEDGKTTEAFVLNGKGKILGFVHVAALADRLLLAGAGAQAKALIEHLDKYIIREDVAVEDVSNSYRARIAPLGKDVEPGDMNRCTVADGEGMITGCGELAGPCRFELLPTSEQDSSAETISGLNCEASASSFKMLLALGPSIMSISNDSGGLLRNAIPITTTIRIGKK